MYNGIKNTYSKVPFLLVLALLVIELWLRSTEGTKFPTLSLELQIFSEIKFFTMSSVNQKQATSVEASYLSTD